MNNSDNIEILENEKDSILISVENSDSEEEENSSSSEIYDNANIDFTTLLQLPEVDYLSSDDDSLDGKSETLLKRKKKRENIFNEMRDDIFEEHNEFTLRAVITGLLIGVIVCAVNVNFGLRTGWTQGGSIFAAIISIAIFRLFESNHRLNISEMFNQWEATITTTVASTVGIMCGTAGLISCIPALHLLGFSFTYWEILLWGYGVCFLGLYIVYPLRKQVLLRDQLTFPTGTATAETINAMISHSRVEDEEDLPITRAGVLLVFSCISGLWSFLCFLLPVLEEPPIPRVIYEYSFSIYLNPLLLGGGMLSGFRASASMFIGSVLGWGVFAPIVQNVGWVEEGSSVQDMEGAKGWILWVGVSIMVGDSVVQLFRTFFHILPYIFYVLKDEWSALTKFFKKIKNKRKKEKKKGRRRGKNGTKRVYRTKEERAERKKKEKQKETEVNGWWLLIGMAFSSFLLIAIGNLYFRIHWYFCLFSIPLSYLLSIMAIRTTGETDINPVGMFGKVTQLIFAGIAPGFLSTNILAAGIVSAGAASSGDFMQDLKTGYLTRVSPRKQFFSQILGIGFGVIAAVSIYWIYFKAYDIGVDNQVSAPGAHAWKAVAVLFDEGFGSIPRSTLCAMGFGFVGGIFLSLLSVIVHTGMRLWNIFWKFLKTQIIGAKEEEEENIELRGEDEEENDDDVDMKMMREQKRDAERQKGIRCSIEMFLPSTLALGLGMLVPAKSSITMFAGALIYQIWYMISKCCHSKSAKRYYFSVSSGLMTGEGLMGIVIALLRLVEVEPLVQKYFY